MLLTVDVDAEALRAERTHEPAPAALTLADAATIAARQTGGEVTSVALDDERAGTSRYALDVRVADGRIARLTLDPATQAPGWRTPPVAYE